MLALRRGATCLGGVAGWRSVWGGRRVGLAAAVRCMSADPFAPGEAIRMPALSPTMNEGQISQWLVEEGQEVAAGDALCEVDTDKATLPFETVEDGVVARVLAKTGDSIAVGTVIGVMVDDADDVAAVQQLQFSDADLAPLRSGGGGGGVGEDEAQSESSGSGSGSGGSGGAAPSADELPKGGFVTPAARHMIESNGLDAAAIPASGPGGRVLKADVLAFMGKIGPQTPWTKRETASPHGRPQPAKAQAQAQAQAPAQAQALAQSSTASSPAAGTKAAAVHERAGGVFTDEKPSTMRSVIAQRLTESKATVPHFYVTMDCHLDELLATRKSLAAAGIKVSVNDMVVKAAANALKDVPQVNAFFDTVTRQVVEQESVDVCVAVATPGGLITPIVKQANALSLPAINTAVTDLATRARAGRLTPDEFQGGSFTISNLGMFGIDHFTAVINPPQSAILAVGGGAKELVFPNGDDTQPPVTVTRMTVQLSADRRVADEAVAAQFLQVFRNYIETPILL